MRSRRRALIIKGMHTLLVIDFWMLLAATAIAAWGSLLTGAWHRRRRTISRP